METALASVKESLAGSDIEVIKTSTESLLTASQSFSQRLYEEASKADAGAGAPGGTSAEDDASDDEVVDAEIVDDKS